MVYTCTHSETNVTTHIISAVSSSTRKPTCMSMPSLTSQVYTVSLKVCASWKKIEPATCADMPKEMATPAMVRVCATQRGRHAAEQAREMMAASQRQQRNGEQQSWVQGLVHAQPFRVLRSSTLMLRRSRNSTTRMARPMADSAAATVSTKNTKICPLMSPR